jgi:phenylalanyl-tRNA synthetase beta chain
MKLSLQWLRDYAPLDAPLETLVEALVDTGTEVAEARYQAHGTVVARVSALTPVAESTKKPLYLADLDVGAGAGVRVVTGATNLRAGDLVPYAPPGTLLPGFDGPLGVRRMLGKYDSPGMILSEVELGLGADATGILVLDRGVPGQPVHQILNLDATIEVEVTSNRPDCLCHVGIARELSAALREPLHEPPDAVPEELMSATAVEGRVLVRIEDPEGCPRFVAHVIENVAVGPSPPWLQERLRIVGLRPINNVVDVTNYVLYELGQPLHAFDLDRFRRQSEPVPAAGAAAEVVVRRARAGERLACLDGVERGLAPEDLAVCAGGRVVSIAGVIGGEATAVDASTRHVLLEAATWDGPTIRATSRRLNLRTDASSHFEKGLSDTLPPLAVERAAALIAELAGGHVLRGRIDEHPRPLPAIEPILVPNGFFDAILGYPVDPSDAATALARLGFQVEQEQGSLTAVPPHVRRDVTLAVDVIEEVGRALGYARVPQTLPGRRSEVSRVAAPTPIEDLVRDVCCGAGFDEAICYAFTSPQAAARLAGVGEGRAAIPIRNPLSEEWSAMRTSVLPGLCQALATNQNRGVEGPALFEIGRGFWEGARVAPPEGSTPDGADSRLPPLPLEPQLLGLVSQAGDVGGDLAYAALGRLQSVLAWLADELGGIEVTVEPADLLGMRPGRSGRVLAAGVAVGVLGELDADAIGGFDLRAPVVVAEVRLDALLPAEPRVPRFTAPPRLPAMERDLNVIVPVGARAGDAISAARRAGATLLESVELIDDYRGAGVAPESKSWTFRLVMRARDRTLTGAEAEAVRAAVAAELERSLAAVVRR